MQNNGTYQILGVIGQGSGGIVYKAVHTRLNKLVVIKQLKHNAYNLTQTRAEVDLLKGLKHTYLPQVLDFIQENGETYTVMDFIDGNDFDVMVSSGRRFSEKEVRKYAFQLCSAVEYLHKQRPPVLHSDIKPANVMLNSSGDICLIDFNVSLIFEGKDSAVLGGTLGYAPPEQFGIPLSELNGADDVRPLIGKVRPNINERSDIFSIGAVLYYILTGVRPAVNYHNRPVGECGVKVSAGMEYIINKAMALDPSRRFRNVSEMLLALKNIGKLDKRYIALRVRREIATIVSAAVIVGGLVLADIGRQTMLTEKEEKYNGYITQVKEFVAAGENESAEELIELSEKLFPTRLEPYYQTITIMYNEKRYEECASYPDTVLTEERLSDAFNDDSLKANIYAVAAESAFELSDFTRACELYRKSIMFDPNNPDCYRDAAISYARVGDGESADNMLAKAENAGVSDDELSLISGEIHWMNGEYIQAFDDFSRTADITENDYILFRSLLACDNMCIKAGDDFRGSEVEMVELLEKHLPDVSEAYYDIIEELLANEYSRCGVSLGMDRYFRLAANCYKDLLNRGKLNYALEKNYFNLAEKIGAYDECFALLDIMASERDDYWIMMNYSWLSITVENTKSIEERDFSKSYEYYLRAKEMYDEYFRESGAADANMDKLAIAIGELKSAHYID